MKGQRCLGSTRLVEEHGKKEAENRRTGEPHQADHNGACRPFREYRRADPSSRSSNEGSHSGDLSHGKGDSVDFTGEEI